MIIKDVKCCRTELGIKSPTAVRGEGPCKQQANRAPNQLVAFRRDYRNVKHFNFESRKSMKVFSFKQSRLG